MTPNFVSQVHPKMSVFSPSLGVCDTKKKLQHKRQSQKLYIWFWLSKAAITYSSHITGREISSDLMSRRKKQTNAVQPPNPFVRLAFETWFSPHMSTLPLDCNLKEMVPFDSYIGFAKVKKKELTHAGKLLLQHLHYRQPSLYERKRTQVVMAKCVSLYCLLILNKIHFTKLLF